MDRDRVAAFITAHNASNSWIFVSNIQKNCGWYLNEGVKTPMHYAIERTFTAQQLIDYLGGANNEMAKFLLADKKGPTSD